jgi:hypothetical protein
MKSTRLLVLAAASLSVFSTVSPATGAASRSYLKPVVPFIENDYTRALAEARSRHVPLFIEAWAPW